MKAPNLIEAARTFILENLRGKEHPTETRHPWRKPWEFALLHSLRVEEYVLVILEQEPHSLSEREVLMLRTAAILHDVARSDGVDYHAAVGAQIVETWLRANPALAEQIEDHPRFLDLIASHSNKDGPESDFCRAVLKDADTLDEIGVMSVFMAANWLERSSPYFFHQLRHQLIEHEIPYCHRQSGRLHTQAARNILESKRRYIEATIAQLDLELKGTLSLEEWLSA